MTHDDEGRRTARYPLSGDAASEVARAVRDHARAAEEAAESWGESELGLMFEDRAWTWRRVADEVEASGALDALLGRASSRVQS